MTTFIIRIFAVHYFALGFIAMISDSATRVATIAINQATLHITTSQVVDILIRHRQDVKDAVDAIQHFTKQGDKVAMYNLAMILTHGIGLSHAIIEVAMRFGDNCPVFHIYAPCRNGNCQTNDRLRREGVNTPFLCYATPKQVNSLSTYRLVSKPVSVVSYPKNCTAPSNLTILTKNPNLGSASKQMSKCTHRLL